MSEGDDAHLTLRLVSQPRYLCAVRAMIDATAERLGFDDDIRGRMVLAIDEALTNVIRHGYQGADDRPIWLRLTPIETGDAKPNGLQITIEDQCPQVDPAKIAGRDLKDIRPGGLGVHIMNEVMDEVDIAPRPGGEGMSVTMRKYLQGLAPRAASR